jgi:hypothetical protein
MLPYWLVLPLIVLFLRSHQLGGAVTPSSVLQVIVHLQLEGWVAAPLRSAVGTQPPSDIGKQLHFVSVIAQAGANRCLEKAARWPCGDLGVLLMNFLRRFGFDFDPETQGISIRHGGVVDRNAAEDSSQKSGVAIEDPQVRGARALCQSACFCGSVPAFHMQEFWSEALQELIA